ncbi:TPA: SctW family type III secretion system gatekeeper subunit YopN [Yersinia enterocolitica]
MTTLHNLSYGNTPLRNEHPEIASSQIVNQTLGQFRGESVQIVSGTLQSIADMAEEVTFVFSERKELSLDKRKLSDSQARVSDVEEQVNQYLSKVPELEQKQNVSELLSLLSNSPNISLSQLKAYLEGKSEEPSEQFKMLCGLRDALKGRPELAHILHLVEQALVSMVEEQEEAIVLGARITPEAYRESQSGVNPLQPLRDTYRDAVMGYQGINAIWSDLQKRFPNGDIDSVILFLQKALSADLQSQQSGSEREKLEIVISDLQKLKEFRSVSDQVKGFWQLFSEGITNGLRPF